MKPLAHWKIRVVATLIVVLGFGLGFGFGLLNPLLGGSGQVRAQTPTKQTVAVFLTSYQINAAAMQSFQGCTVGDTGCETGLLVCDETKKCLYYPAGAHTLTFSFVSNGGSEPGNSVAVANASIQVVVQ